MFFKKRLFQPYPRIISIQDELKEYKKVCKGKSKKHFYYLDWKADIEDKLKELESHESQENFKHYLINCKRSLNSFEKCYIPIMACFLTVMFDKIESLFPYTDVLSEQWQNIIKTTLILGLLVYFIIDLVKSNRDNNLSYCFYCDLIEMMENNGNEHNEKRLCLTPNPTTKTQ